MHTKQTNEINEIEYILLQNISSSMYYKLLVGPSSYCDFVLEKRTSEYNIILRESTSNKSLNEDYVKLKADADYKLVNTQYDNLKQNTLKISSYMNEHNIHTNV